MSIYEHVPVWVQFLGHPLVPPLLLALGFWGLFLITRKDKPKVVLADRRYQPLPSNEHPVLKAALVSCGSAAAVAVVYLSFHFIASQTRAKDRTSATDSLETVGPIDVVPKKLEATSILNFGSICDGCCSDRTFPLKGAIAGNLIRQGWPPNLPTGMVPSMLVAENDTVSARICNVGTAKTVTYNSVHVRAMIER